MFKAMVFALGLIGLLFAVDAAAQIPERTDKERDDAIRLVVGFMSSPKYSLYGRPIDKAASRLVFDRFAQALCKDQSALEPASVEAPARYRDGLAGLAIAGRASRMIHDIVAEVRCGGEPVLLDSDRQVDLFLKTYMATIDPRGDYWGKAESIEMNELDVADEKEAAVTSDIRSHVVESDGRLVGVLQLGAVKYHRFGALARAVHRELDVLQQRQVQGIVLDLRDNTGSTVLDIMEVASMFAGPGPMLQVKGYLGHISSLEGEKSVVWSGPLAVLVNRGTSTGGELLAVALQDQGRALIVGERSAGVGTIQINVSLDRSGQAAPIPTYGRIRVTVGEIFRLDGQCLHGVGVLPDVVLGAGTGPAVASNIKPSKPIASLSGYKRPPRPDIPLPSIRRHAADDEWLERAIGVLEI